MGGDRLEAVAPPSLFSRVHYKTKFVLAHKMLEDVARYLKGNIRRQRHNCCQRRMFPPATNFVKRRRHSRLADIKATRGQQHALSPHKPLRPPSSKLAVAKGTELMSDKAGAWNCLHAAFPMSASITNGLTAQMALHERR
jgi:hypothetical protein